MFILLSITGGVGKVVVSVVEYGRYPAIKLRITCEVDDVIKIGKRSDIRVIYDAIVCVVIVYGASPRGGFLSVHCEFTAYWCISIEEGLSNRSKQIF